MTILHLRTQALKILLAGPRQFKKCCLLRWLVTLSFQDPVNEFTQLLFNVCVCAYVCVCVHSVCASSVPRCGVTYKGVCLFYSSSISAGKSLDPTSSPQVKFVEFAVKQSHPHVTSESETGLVLHNLGRIFPLGCKGQKASAGFHQHIILS